VITGILAAISILRTCIGYIPVPNLSGVTHHACASHYWRNFEGPVVDYRAVIFGITSMLQGGGTIFADPFTSVLPRLFVAGVAAYYSHAAVRGSNEYTALIVSSIVGIVNQYHLVVGMLIVRGYLLPPQFLH